MSRIFSRFRVIFFLFLIFYCTSILLSRAGGGGGSSSGGSSSSSSSSSTEWTYETNNNESNTETPPFSEWPLWQKILTISVFGVLGIIALFFLFIFLSALFSNIIEEIKNLFSPSKSILYKIPDTPKKLNDASSKVTNLDFSFDREAFIKKAELAFLKIQEAWCKQSLRTVRKFISDGIYQRFHAQFLMMKEIEQENLIDNIKILESKIIDAKKDGNYMVIDVSFYASMNDRFISKKFSSIREFYNEPFVEIWTFIRKINPLKDGNLYTNQNCPQCGGAIDELEGEVCQCPFCKTILNTGEFDWILSEITQVEDYTASKQMSYVQHNLKEIISSLYEKDPYFSIHLMEDKASNAFIQVLISYALNEPKRLRRFTDDDFFNSFQSREKTVLSRLYLNFVTLIDAWQQEGRDYLAFHIKVSFRRLRIIDNKLEWIDPEVVSRSRILIMTRDANAALPKGSLYAHRCPSCGSNLEDTLFINCSHCGEILNSPKHEWIVFDLLTPEAFQRFKNNGYPKKFKGSSDDIYKIRDYVLNNVCVVLAADKKIDDQEMEYITSLAKKLGYSSGKLDGFIKLARDGKLTLKIPTTLEAKKEVFKLMKEAADINQNLTETEKSVLIEFEKYISETEIDDII